MKRSHAQILWKFAYKDQGKMQRASFLFVVIAGVIESVLGWVDMLK